MKIMKDMKKRKTILVTITVIAAVMLFSS